MARAEHAAKLEAMTDEQRAKHEEERQAKREIRKKEAEEAKAKKQAALEAPNAVVLDLEFGHLMSDKEQKSMAKQLTFCYSANTKAAVPLRLYLTGLAGSMGEFTRKHNSGFSNWAVHKCDGSYLEALADRKDDLVYLTADSEHELEDFKESDVYIIGGIVDRNRHKNLTLNKANEQGIRHARLPIRDHPKMTGTHILTVNQTLDIIHAQLELKNWEKALERVVPLRKRKEAEEEGKEGGATIERSYSRRLKPLTSSASGRRADSFGKIRPGWQLLPSRQPLSPDRSLPRGNRMAPSLEVGAAPPATRQIDRHPSVDMFSVASGCASLARVVCKRPCRLARSACVAPRASPSALRRPRKTRERRSTTTSSPHQAHRGPGEDSRPSVRSAVREGPCRGLGSDAQGQGASGASPQAPAGYRGCARSSSGFVVCRVILSRRFSLTVSYPSTPSSSCKRGVQSGRYRRVCRRMGRGGRSGGRRDARGNDPERPERFRAERAH